MPKISFSILRRCINRVTLAEACDVLLAAIPGLSVEYAVSEGETVAAAIGLHSAGLVVREVLLHDRPVTIVCVPLEVWHCTASMTKLVGLRRAMSTIGRKVVLVCEGWVRRHPRMPDAEFGKPAVTRSTMADRIRLLAYLIEHGDAPLSKLASLVPGDDPVSSILDLSTLGLLHVDLELPILSDSRVGLARPE